MKKGKSVLKRCGRDVKKGFLALILVVFLTFPTISHPNNEVLSILPAGYSKLSVSSEYILYAPIKIDGNTDLADQAISNGWKGNGTEEDPYIIEGYEINGTDFGYGIYLQNVTDYFVVRNCYIHDAGMNSNGSFGSAGIHLCSVQNGRIYNNTISNNRCGIFLHYCENNTITDNNITCNRWEAIHLLCSNRTSIIGNTVSESYYYGIYLYSSNGNNISANSISRIEDTRGSGTGIYMNSSRNNIVSSNTISNVGGEDVQQREVPIDAVFVLDTSGSMDGEPLEDLKKAVKDFIGNLSSEDRMAIWTFDGGGYELARPHLMEPFAYMDEMNKTAFNSSLDNLSAGGYTPFYDTLGEAINYSLQDDLDASDNSRLEFVIGITDGISNSDDDWSPGADWGTITHEDPQDYDQDNVHQDDIGLKGLLKAPPMVFTIGLGITHDPGYPTAPEWSHSYSPSTPIEYDLWHVAESSGWPWGKYGREFDIENMGYSSALEFNDPDPYFGHYYYAFDSYSLKSALKDIKDTIHRISTVEGAVSTGAGNITERSRQIIETSSNRDDVQNRGYIGSFFSLLNTNQDFTVPQSPENREISEETTINETPPAVLKTYPADGKTALESQYVTVVFDKVMDTSIIPELVQIAGPDPGGWYFEGWLSTYRENDTAIWSHYNWRGWDAALRVSNYYDIYGQTGAAYTWEFDVITNSSQIGAGIYLRSTSTSQVKNNSIEKNRYGIYVVYSEDNTIYHNNFIENAHQAYEYFGNNLWNSSYPTGGNYWSDYNGTDFYSGPGQNITGSDGIGDVPYTEIEGWTGAKDNYPLMSPYVWDRNPPHHSNEHPYKYTYSPKTTIWVHVADQSGINSSTIRLYVQGFSVFYDLKSIPNGYNVSYYHESGFSEGEEVTCRIVAEDIYGNKLDYSWSFTVLSRENITLHQGWNLITIRWSDEPVDIKSAIDGNWTRAMVYIDNQWYTYNKNREAKYNLGFPKLNSTIGLWIYSPSADTLVSYYLSTPTETKIQLHKGWNLVGYPSGNDSKVSDALAGVPWTHLQTADANGKIYSLSPQDYLIVGRAYWIYVTSNCEWIVKW